MGGIQVSRQAQAAGYVDAISNLALRSATRGEASLFLSNFEILGNAGLGVWHWGLSDNHRLVSLVTYGCPGFSSTRGWLSLLAKKYGVKLIQLCRGGTLPSQPKGTGSRTIALANRAMLKKHGPFIAVAYANEALGEVGTIYQAAGALYTGMTRPKGQAMYYMDEKWQSAWQIRRAFGTRDRERLKCFDQNVQVHLLKPKHRYIFVVAARTLKRRLMAEVAARCAVYPKRHGEMPTPECALETLRAMESPSGRKANLRY